MKQSHEYEGVPLDLNVFLNLPARFPIPHALRYMTFSFEASNGLTFRDLLVRRIGENKGETLPILFYNATCWIEIS